MGEGQAWHLRLDWEVLHVLMIMIPVIGNILCGCGLWIGKMTLGAIGLLPIAHGGKEERRKGSNYGLYSSHQNAHKFKCQNGVFEC